MSGDISQNAQTPRKLNKSDQMVTQFAEWVIRWRWAVIALCFALVGAAAYGGQNLGFSTNYRVFFSEENPQLQAFEELQKVYIRDDNIMLVIKPEEGTALTPELLEGIRNLTNEAWKTPYATRVDSITNFQNSTAVEDDLIVEDLVPEGTPYDAADLARIKNAILTEPMLTDRLISEDLKTVAVNITLTLPFESEAEVPEAMVKIKAMAEQFQADFPNTRVATTGSIALNNAFFESSMRDMGTLVPAMYGVLLLVMVLLLRSVSGTFATLMVIGFSAATGMGLTGWFGIMLTPPSAMAPTIILTLAIADSIHILITMIQSMRGGMTKREAIIESLRINFQPVFLTSLTTIIGFVSLNFSDAPPFRDLGNITAMGVAAAWFYSILFLPALMSVLPMRVKQADSSRSKSMDVLANFVIDKRRIVLPGTIAIVLALVAFIPRIELNDQFVEYFDESLAFRSDTDFAMENLSGIYQSQWSLPAASSGGINDPEYLEQVSRFTDWLRARGEVVHVATVSDIFKRLNKNMHGDDPDWYKLPDERNLAAQYLLLFEMSLPYGLDLNNQINVDKSATRIIATLENMTTNDLRRLDRDARNWFDQNMPSAAGTDSTGPFPMFAYIAKRNIEGMLVGTFAAFILISLTLLVALRSFKLGLISLAPNLLPAFMAFGVWAIMIGEVGLSSSVVAATSLGIIVDATVHFLSKYQRAQRVRGDNPEDAVRYAFSTVGVALWVTTAILIAGFAVLSLSTFRINSVMGMLTAITLAFAIVVDFLLLPTLLLAIDKKKKAGAAPTATAPAIQSAE